MEAKATSTKVKAPSKTTAAMASENIHQIFKPIKATKKQRIKAAIIIQKNFRGWLQRHYYAVAKKKALRRSTCFKMFLDKYREHCQEIMKRHDEENPIIYINFFYVNEYIDKLIRFEVTFQMMVNKDNQHLPFKEFRNYYTKCNLHPTAKEMEGAALAVCPDPTKMNEYLFTKREIVDASFHIYVPKGTKAKPRKSTWLHPIVDGKEATSAKLTKADVKKTSLAQSLAVVCDAREKREERKVELIDKYTGQEVGKLAASFHTQPRSSTSISKVRKAKSSHKRA